MFDRVLAEGQFPEKLRNFFYTFFPENLRSTASVFDLLLLLVQIFFLICSDLVFELNLCRKGRLK